MSTSETSGAFTPRWRQWLFPNRQAVIWPLVYAATVAALLGWYELLPRIRIYRELPGVWQLTAGKDHQEKALPVFWQIAGNETRVYRQPEEGSESSDWSLSKSTISVRPSRDFFIVRRNYSFGKPGRSYDQEYVICLHDDKFYIINGVGQISPSPEYGISMLRRATDVPQSLQDRIASDK